MFAKVLSMGVTGIESFPVTVEADLHRALPRFDIVGLPDAAVKEAKDRVRAALSNSGFRMPEAALTVNLAPAHTRKSGSLYDLPILLAIVSAAGLCDFETAGCAFVGELSLDGSVRPVSGVLSMAMAAREAGVERFFIPAENAAEGSVAEGIEVYPIRSVREALDALTGRVRPVPASQLHFEAPPAPPLPDFADVRGQENAKRALEIAAAGSHNLLLIGPPGTGKSMLAKRLPSILPEMTREEAIEATKVHSIAGMLPSGVPLLTARPFRSPHHTSSPAGLTGGGSSPRPGEISLAHQGVLFLDELPQFSRGAMEILRQPMEDGVVTISRAAGRVSYPSRFMLVAAMNPCPCGYFGHPTRECTCSPTQAAIYLSRISGPMLDRLDIHVEVPPVEYDALSAKSTGESSAQIRARVAKARKAQTERYSGCGVTCNGQLTPALLRRFCTLSDDANRLLRAAYDRLGLSGRSYDRLLRVSRTIADLAGEDVISSAHLAEAIQYRNLDRKYWQQDTSEL